MKLLSCVFNMDTACVELKFDDGSMIAIDTIAVVNEVADNMYQQSELDNLIYNDPVASFRLAQPAQTRIKPGLFKNLKTIKHLYNHT
ncbi:MAG TPA: hypothetical protein DEW37_09635 [Oscillibacter sp.]|nr:hypothetical protein [Oscillibacter sp.]